MFLGEISIPNSKSRFWTFTKIIIVIVRSSNIFSNFRFSTDDIAQPSVEVKNAIKPTKEELELWEGYKRSFCENSPPPVKQVVNETFEHVKNAFLPWPTSRIPFLISSNFSEKVASFYSIKVIQCFKIL